MHPAARVVQASPAVLGCNVAVIMCVVKIVVEIVVVKDSPVVARPQAVAKASTVAQLLELARRMVSVLDVAMRENLVSVH